MATRHCERRCELDGDETAVDESLDVKALRADPNWADLPPLLLDPLSAALFFGQVSQKSIPPEIFMIFLMNQ